MFDARLCKVDARPTLRVILKATHDAVSAVDETALNVDVLEQQHVSADLQLEQRRGGTLIELRLVAM